MHLSPEGWPRHTRSRGRGEKHLPQHAAIAGRPLRGGRTGSVLPQQLGLLILGATWPNFALGPPSGRAAPTAAACPTLSAPPIPRRSRPPARRADRVFPRTPIE